MRIERTFVPLELCTGAPPHAEASAPCTPGGAPGLLTMCVGADLIAEVIGLQGSTVRAIAAATGAIIDVADDGRITIRADSLAVAGEAQSRIEEVLRDAVVIGKAYEAIVVEVIEFFGAHVEIRPGRRGLLHTSRMHAATTPGIGETVRVQVIGRNRDGLFETTMLPPDRGRHHEPDHIQRLPGPRGGGHPRQERMK